MAVIACPDCEKDVSEHAEKCLNCGAPIASRIKGTPRKPTSPWTIIGWMIVAAIVLPLATCAFVASRVANSAYDDYGRRVRLGVAAPAEADNSMAAPSAASYSMKVVSVECTDNYGRNKANITARNTGSTAIPFAKVFIQFKNKTGGVISAQDSYFSPTTIPSGATASATVYSSGGGAKTCGPVAIQDRYGASVSFQ
jgi:hypothetical protein